MDKKLYEVWRQKHKEILQLLDKVNKKEWQYIEKSNQSLKEYISCIMPYLSDIDDRELENLVNRVCESYNIAEILGLNECAVLVEYFERHKEYDAALSMMGLEFACGIKRISFYEPFATTCSVIHMSELCRKIGNNFYEERFLEFASVLAEKSPFVGVPEYDLKKTIKILQCELQLRRGNNNLAYNIYKCLIIDEKTLEAEGPVQSRGLFWLRLAKLAKELGFSKEEFINQALNAQISWMNLMNIDNWAGEKMPRRESLSDIVRVIEMFRKEIMVFVE